MRNASNPTFALGSVSAIGAGFTHSLAVKTDGTAWASGLNGNGQGQPSPDEHLFVFGRHR